MSEETQTIDVIKPQGFKILIAIPAKKEKTDGGIVIPDSAQDRESLATITGNVIELGPMAYQDKDKFPTGPWCATGDWILFRAFAGTRFKIKGQEFRLLNDDTVDAVVSDPRLIERA